MVKIIVSYVKLGTEPEVKISPRRRAASGGNTAFIATFSVLPFALFCTDRLLVQLDETAVNFDTFWMSHRHRLEQCLQLRHFEEQFKQVSIYRSAFIANRNEVNLIKSVSLYHLTTK